jgi:hypothetical protein
MHLRQPERGVPLQALQVFQRFVASLRGGSSGRPLILDPLDGTREKLIDSVPAVIEVFSKTASRLSVIAMRVSCPRHVNCAGSESRPVSGLAGTA